MTCIGTGISPETTEIDAGVDHKDGFFDDDASAVVPKQPIETGKMIKQTRKVQI